jgi:hypothetical protein
LKVESWARARGEFPATLNQWQSTFGSQAAFFEFLFGFGRLGVAAGFLLIVPLANLAFDFLGDQINGGIEIFFAILGKQVRPANSEADGAGESFFGSAFVVVFQRDARINDALVEMFHPVEFIHHVVFDRLGQRDIVSVKDKFHIRKDALEAA